MQSESLRQANGMFWKRQWEEKELVWLGGLEVPPPTLGCEYFSATSVAASFLQPHCCRGTYVLSGNIWKAFPLWMYEVHIKKPDKDVNFRLLQPGGSSQAVCRPATMLPPPQAIINSFYSRRDKTHTRSVVTTTGCCSVFPLKAWWSVAT